jgi:hypothetical protein
MAHANCGDTNSLIYRAKHIRIFWLYSPEMHLVGKVNRTGCSSNRHRFTFNEARFAGAKTAKYGFPRSTSELTLKNPPIRVYCSVKTQIGSNSRIEQIWNTNFIGDKRDRLEEELYRLLDTLNAPVPVPVVNPIGLTTEAESRNPSVL